MSMSKTTIKIKHAEVTFLHLNFPNESVLVYTKCSTEVLEGQFAEESRTAKELPGARLFQRSGAGGTRSKSALGVHQLSYPGCDTSFRSISGCKDDVNILLKHRLHWCLIIMSTMQLKWKWPITLVYTKMILKYTIGVYDCLLCVLGRGIRFWHPFLP